MVWHSNNISAYTTIVYAPATSIEQEVASMNHLVVLYSIMELQLYQVCVFIMSEWLVCSILTACKDAYNTQEEQLSCSVGCNLNANEDTYICTNEVRERL